MYLFRQGEAARENGNWNGRKADEENPRDPLTGAGENGTELAVVQAERLKKAADSVAEMEGQKKDGDEVEDADRDVLKSEDYDGIDVVKSVLIVKQKGTRLNVAKGEMSEVENDECQYEKTRVAHGFCKHRGRDAISTHVFLRSCRQISGDQRNSEADVKADNHEQSAARNPK